MTVRTVITTDSPEAEAQHLASAAEAKRGPRAKIWIDLDNTPHVPLFIPIIRELEGRGHTVVVTARDAFQVSELARQKGLAVVNVGRHFGKNRIMKVLGLVWRSVQLAPHCLRERPHLALSHGSRSKELLGRLLGIPTVSMNDDEYSAMIPLAHPRWGIVPDAISPEESGCHPERLLQYRGIKEDVYAPEFKPDESLMDELGLRGARLVVTVRPPATEAHYHNPEAEGLYVDVVERLGRTEGVRMVILPRTAGAQRDFVLATWPELCATGRIILPERALDGLNLVWHSDLVVSGGGTMNREAAALGVPVYSIFRGKLGAVDRYLAEDGRLVMLASRDEVHQKIRVEKRSRVPSASPADRPALRQILEAAYELMELADDRR
jgi:hypothetical protein